MRAPLGCWGSCPHPGPCRGLCPMDRVLHAPLPCLRESWTWGEPSAQELDLRRSQGGTANLSLLDED